MRQKRICRAGFTLVELMVAISIIALLIGLLMPAISSARRNANVAEVKTEISALGQALADFKAKFGEYPPSRITLYKTADGWSSDNRSKTIIRRFWPSFDFTSDGAGGSFSQAWPGESISLDGAECLLFFVGGVRDIDGVHIGFSSNPSQPFSVQPTRSRVGPFFEIDTGRLSDGDGDGLPEYLDTLPGQTTPYLYLSSYDGAGYRCQDWTLIDGMFDAYRLSEGEIDTNRNCMADASEDINGNGRLDFGSAYKAKSFQIISPGFDGKYGPGGVYNPESEGFDLTTADHDDPPDGEIGPHERREPERDNITNFHSGMLAD